MRSGRVTITHMPPVATPRPLPQQRTNGCIHGCLVFVVFLAVMAVLGVYNLTHENDPIPNDWVPYRAQYGDTVSQLVEANHGIYTAEWYEYWLITRNGIEDPNKLLVGQRLLLPKVLTPAELKALQAQKGANHARP